MKRLCYLGISEEGFFSIFKSSAVDLVERSQKIKELVTAFRHLNVRISKNNLSYPL